MFLFQAGSDGIKLLAIKFVEAMILAYTPDPNGSSDPPHEVDDGKHLLTEKLTIKSGRMKEDS